MRTGHDAIVVGGGPAGATAAILLARAGWRVAVIEKAPFPRRKVCGEFISATTWPLLAELGVAELLMPNAGPDIRRIGVYVGDLRVTAPMPAQRGGPRAGGRALGREHLDNVMLHRAQRAGAQVLQPWALDGVQPTPNGYACRITRGGSGETQVLHAPVLVAAHGSWESGPLPTQQFRNAPRASDLLAFKARFIGGALPADLMPLIAFPGGYGGMVNTGGGRISVSCCIRRDALAACRRPGPLRRAGAAVLAHMNATCTGVAATLSADAQEGAWLAAGPIRSGIRGFGRDGIFAVGNAAAEAHPIVAEGISMAIQSSALLCEQLIARQGRSFTPEVLAAIHRDYAAAWRQNFSRRLHAAALFAGVFMRPVTARAAGAVLAHFPQVLDMGVRWSGKADPLAGRSSQPRYS